MKTEILQFAEVASQAQAETSLIELNSAALEVELDWLKQVIENRIGNYFDSQHWQFETFPPPQHPSQSYYGHFVTQYRLSPSQRLALIMALAIEIEPQILDIFQVKNKKYDLPYAEFGGLLNHNRPGFLPTVQTALFLLAGDDPQAKLSALRLFEPAQTLFFEDILKAGDSSDHSIHWPLKLSEDSRQHLLYGTQSQQNYSAHFPATLLQTEYNWEDLVLSSVTEEHLQELELWLQHRENFLKHWGMSKSHNRGYKALFYGPPGTGKSLTATLLGKRLGQPVYRIDLSQIVSKYIGETEKNLERVFQKAHKQQWILFFDEADALFGKRTNVNTSNDRHANQEVAYLLQRIESCENLVILASNLKDNIDEAFLRRFQSIIHFPNPDLEERKRLWQQGFSKQADLSEINMRKLVDEYELSGAEINNIIRYCSLMAIDQKTKVISPRDVLNGLRREKMKSGQLL